MAGLQPASTEKVADWRQQKGDFFRGAFEGAAWVMASVILCSLWPADVTWCGPEGRHFTAAAFSGLAVTGILGLLWTLCD